MLLKLRKLARANPVVLNSIIITYARDRFHLQKEMTGRTNVERVSGACRMADWIVEILGGFIFGAVIGYVAGKFEPVKVFVSA